jgi:ribosomal protein S18 acetylase RimI-like enzyme
MVNKDLEKVTDIEHESSNYENILTEDEITVFLRQNDTVGLVAEVDEQIAGFCLYRLKTNSLIVYRLVVSPYYRRFKIGTQIVEKLKQKMSFGNRTHLTIAVSERNIEGQLFLRANGFVCYKTKPNFFEENDAYCFKLEAKNAVTK